MKYKKLQDILDNLSPFLKNIEIQPENQFLPKITVYLFKNWDVLENDDIKIDIIPFNDRSNICYFSSENLIIDDVVNHIANIIQHNQEKEEKQRIIAEKLEKLKQEMLSKNLDELKGEKKSKKNNLSDNANG